MRNHPTRCTISTLYAVIVIFQIFQCEFGQGEEMSSTNPVFLKIPWTASSAREDEGISHLGILCSQWYRNCFCLDGNENKTGKVQIFRLHVVTNKSDVVESGLLQEGGFDENLCLAGGSAAHKQTIGKILFWRNDTKRHYPSLANWL